MAEIARSVAPLHLVDGTLFFFRAYFGVPDLFFDARGRSVNGVRGYLQFLLGHISEHQVRFAAVAFDESLTTCFRNEIYPEYKANRPPADEDIRFQLGLCRRLTRELGILTLADRRYEADDILATLTARARRPVLLLSRDKDLQQLLRPGVEISAGSGDAPMDAAEFSRRRGFAPALFPDYQALAGDAVDNVPGVPGVGAKTATRLVSGLGSLESIYAQPERWSELGIKVGGRMEESLLGHRQQARLFRRILRLHRRVPLGYATGELRVGRLPVERVMKRLTALGIGGLRKLLEELS